MACDKYSAMPIVAPILSPNDLEIIKYSPPPSTLLLLAISEMARAVGIVTICPRRIIPITPQNPTLPTAKPNLKNKIAPRMVLIAVKNTGAVPNFRFDWVDAILSAMNLTNIANKICLYQVIIFNSFLYFDALLPVTSLNCLLKCEKLLNPHS